MRSNLLSQKGVRAPLRNRVSLPANPPRHRPLAGVSEASGSAEAGGPGAGPRLGSVRQDGMPRLALALLFLPLLAACGEPRPPGGEGRLEHVDGMADLLVVEGSPYEMGWWHGHLLKEAIRARAASFAGAGPYAHGAQAKALAGFVDVCVDQAFHRLSERMREEIEGMSAATGVDAKALIRPEVARDAVRMKLDPDLVTGGAALQRDGGGYEGRMVFDPGARDFAGKALLIHRKPEGRSEEVVLARPGSLGGWAAITADGRGYLLAEVEIRNKRQLGFGGGRPLTIAAREALEATEDAEGLMAQVTGTMGHIGLGVSGHPHHQPPVHAMAGVQVYAGGDPPWSLGADPVLVIGPQGDPTSPEARAFREGVAGGAGLTNEERWLRLASKFPAQGGASPPQVTIAWHPGHARMAWRPGPGDVTREVVLRGE